MADTQTNEIVIQGEELEEIRKLIGEANELFRRVGILEAEKVGMLTYIQKLNEGKQQFMEKIGGVYGLDPQKLHLYTVDLETGKILEMDPEKPNGGIETPSNGN